MFFRYPRSVRQDAGNGIWRASSGGGIGIVFRGRGASGGSDIVARIIHKYSNCSLGASFLFLYTAIIISTDRKTLYCIVTIRQLEKVRRIIREVDTGAFVSVFNLSILQGEGFRSRTALFED